MLGNGSSEHIRNGSAASNRMSQEIPFPRHMSSGSLNIPSGLGVQAGPANGQPFAGPRSPPNKQSMSPRFTGLLYLRHDNHCMLTVDLEDTSHVPCKFFRQGACQAGKACPFSHDLAATVDNVCKYFAKVGVLAQIVLS